MTRREAIDYIIDRLIAGEEDLGQIKREAGNKFKISSMITNPEILAQFPASKLTSKIKDMLIKKPTKTISGVTPVAVMIKPQDSCKYACIYCPFTGLAAKSYLGYEPAALRGRNFSFDPYMQVSSRAEQFETGGHATDKCEVIIMGGTFLGMDKNYKEYFIKGVYEGLNGKRSHTLQHAIKTNETAKHRVIGLTIETRPDMCSQYIDEMLSYGATRVELGVQHADDEIYKIINRGHTTADVISATRDLKDAAFKVLYHIMPGLPGSNMKKDIAFVKKLFNDKNFRPDMLKIYPTLVVGGTVLQKWAEEGKYNPYTTEEAAEVISEFYRYIPKYVRVMRIQRDIPAGRINSGVRKSNLRELVEAKLREKGIIPQEIRYREVKRKHIKLADFELKRLDYEASQGKEIFLSYENENLIAGFLRLRFPQETSVAFVRELHVYGSEVPISGNGKVQHKGFGSKLLQEAEEIAKENGKEKMLIISGVGVRPYYSKYGYSFSGSYMCRNL
ncbi:tRNA uridine(34) 5-carboxymethylaminomethyl modification radical SAM/GNAT enzyme Elp3 [Candidatus Micrarchaeota archaeon]|nr:tRNA uridine(34) 5-carboxymethylaminomethyl modification radical SAM/GNAT enzyme Elp3 [Candidatus Micrarchaeota archaeon]